MNSNLDQKLRWFKSLSVNYVFYLLSILFFLSACFQKKELFNLPLENTLRVTISVEPPTLDWNKATDVTSSLIIDNIMEGLVDQDFSQGAPRALPALAEKWTATKDKKHWIFTLKTNVLWSDGKPLTAHHFKDSWERLLNPKTASEYAYFLYDVKNAQAYNTGQIKDFSQVGISVDSKGRLRVELEKGKSYFPFLLAHTSTYPIRKDIIHKYTHSWTRPHNIVTLGAYQLKQWKHDERILLERNKNYYRSPAKIKHVLIYIIAEGATVLNLFNRGQLDAVTSLPSSQLPALKKKKEFREHPILAIYYYGMNVKKYPFNDVRVRKAFCQAIDRRQIIHLLQADHIPLTSWLPKGMFGYNPSLGLSFDPSKARSLLIEAGYSNQNPFPKIILSYNTQEDHKRVAESVQAQLKKNLNIKVELSSQEWKTYLQFLKTGEQQLYRLGWQADYPDPHNFMNLMSSYSANNRTFWQSDNYDALIKAAAVLPDGKERRNLYRKAQKILVETEVPVIPLYSVQSHWLIHRRIAIFPLNVMNRIHFRKVVLH